LNEQHFEAAMWQRLQAFHAIDAASHDWDPEVSSDPESPHFSMSIGGRGFYVIGLHPDASRTARRFHCAALVFNLHSQFEALRADSRYDKLRTSITERDIAFSGSRNPMLATHGVSSEARQYSGRQVHSDWRCPFNATTDGRRDAA
jgi:FPC/CPF motif-containing protein YcgG